jgi:UDP-N-acetylmuramyl pentapeptide synthase
MDPDSPLVATVIATAAVCAVCIAVKVGLAVTRVDEALVQVRSTIIVTSRVAPCDSCRKQTVVHQLG